MITPYPTGNAALFSEAIRKDVRILLDWTEKEFTRVAPEHWRLDALHAMQRLRNLVGEGE